MVEPSALNMQSTPSDHTSLASPRFQLLLEERVIMGLISSSNMGFSNSNVLLSAGADFFSLMRNDGPHSQFKFARRPAGYDLPMCWLCST